MIREPNVRITKDNGLDQVLLHSIDEVLNSWDVVVTADCRTNFADGTLHIYPEGNKISYRRIQNINSGSVVDFEEGVVIISGMKKTDPRIREVRFYSSREYYEKRQV